MIGRSRPKPRAFSQTVAATGWGESTFAELQWDRSRGAGRRWGVAGVVVGVLLAVLLFAPAAWLAAAVASATEGRVLLADARGTVWNGSATVVLTGGPGSRDASALPGRLDWTLRPAGLGFELRAQQACCMSGGAVLGIQPGLGRLTITLAPGRGAIGQWPTAWLGGLGTPFNTMQMGGMLRLSSPGLTLESAQGRWRMTGRAELELVDVSSRVSTLDTLGSYRLTVAADPAGAAQLSLVTLQGALQLSGSGSAGPSGLRFRGEARANPGDEAALANLLNIIGRRDGARSVISIG